MRFFWYIFALLSISACNNDQSIPATSGVLFDALPATYTNVTFNNALHFTEEYNPYTFKNFFNGGGVGLGDFNNDNLVDIYLTGNLVDNKLYLNQGDFKFKDITESAGVACENVWSSGVSLVDINADNLLDIYVCKSGEPEPIGNRKNELFINNGDLTFTEDAAAYGLDFEGLAVHAVFFDMDLDGDLDCYLLNNSIRSIGGYDMIPDQRNIPNPNGGNMLLKSMWSESGGQDKKYLDVTQQAGIYSSDIGFGLGVSVSDLNGDGWPDIFVSNDFFEKDYLYINNQDGTFIETVDQSMQELSMGSMGADIADINNDGKQDIFVTEMLPSTLERTKSKAVFETFEKSELNYKKGYHRQYGRNALHLALGNPTKNTPVYSEVSRYTGTEATEWSWGALIEDFDQDGLKDIFVANGIYKDLLDQDYLNFYNPDQIRKLIQTGEQNAITKMFESMPSSPYPNAYFKNQGDLGFKDEGKEAGFSIPTFSNGSAYADLDNDGDLDLVTNNIESAASIYRNNSNQSYISLLLEGKEGNTQAIGSTVICYVGDEFLIKEHYPMKGFESTVDRRIVFPNLEPNIDSIQVIWPDRSESTLRAKQIVSDTLLILKQSNTSKSNELKIVEPNSTLLQKVNDLIPYIHKENSYTDYNNSRTQTFFISNEGPKLKVADLDGDKKQDLIIGGSKDRETKTFLQKGSSLIEKKLIAGDTRAKEDCDFLISDLNGDGRNDIYIASGGIEFPQASSGLKDKAYFWKNGQYQEANNARINTGFSSSSAVVHLDYDSDGDLDILVSERLKPQAYGVKADILVYENSDNRYTRKVPKGILKAIGLVTDMHTADLDGDGLQELVIACEYDNIKVLRMEGDKQWKDVSTTYGLTNFNGKWNRIRIDDIDKDGDLDILATNLGLNNRISTLTENHAILYVNDFDRNGSIETILCAQTELGDKPLTLRDDLLMQLPFLKKKVLSYALYADATMQSLFEPTILAQSITYPINEFRTGIFYNTDGIFEFKPLPKEAQWTDQRAILVKDMNNDGRKDILLGGNQYKAKPELGINAGTYGQLFLQGPESTFNPVSIEESGLFETGEIRDFEIITIAGKEYLIIAKNNSEIATYLFPKRK